MEAAGAGAFTAVAVSTAVDLGGSAAADFTPVSPTCTVVSAMATGVTGTMAGITDATAGGGVTGWEEATIRMITDGMAIRITAIMATPSLTLVRLGTIAPIRQAITLT